MQQGGKQTMSHTLLDVSKVELNGSVLNLANNEAIKYSKEKIIITHWIQSIRAVDEL